MPARRSGICLSPAAPIEESSLLETLRRILASGPGPHENHGRVGGGRHRADTNRSCIIGPKLPPRLLTLVGLPSGRRSNASFGRLRMERALLQNHAQNEA